MRTFVLAAVIALATVTPSAGRTARPAALPRGAILFRSDHSAMGAYHLYVTDARGGGLKDLGLISFGQDAHWSPDGRRIAFATQVGGTKLYDLVVRNAAGGRARRLARADSGQFSWSPDGTRVAFTESVAGHSVIATIRVDGRGRHQVTRPGSSDERWPAWSPSGRLIAFDHGEGCGRLGDPCGLYVVRPDGKGLRRIPTGTTDSFPPIWSPDGKRVGFTCCGGEAYIVTLRGRRTRIAPGKGFRGLAWSPNGKWIALAASGATFVVRPDGTGYRQIAKSGDSVPSWSSDSRAIVVDDQIEGQCCDADLVAVAVDGSREQRLTQGWRYGYSSFAPEWNPRGISLPKVGGKLVPAANLTDSDARDGVLRTTSRVTRLSADGPIVAALYESGLAEAWNPAAGSLVRFGGVWPAKAKFGFTFAGERLAVTNVSYGPGADVWLLDVASLSMPRRDESSFSAAIGSSSPVEHLAGDGALLVADVWGPCRISQVNLPCVSQPRFGGRLLSLEASAVTVIAHDPGPLTLQAVDRDRILVDRENGTLQLFSSHGNRLQAIAYGPLKLLGANLEDNDVVELTAAGLADYDASSGTLRHQWTLAAPDPRLVDVQNGIAVYLSGNDIHLLRLADGADARIRAEGGGPMLATLEATGLYYSYALDDGAFHGRVVFVPFASLPLP